MNKLIYYITFRNPETGEVAVQIEGVAPSIGKLAEMVLYIGDNCVQEHLTAKKWIIESIYCKEIKQLNLTIGIAYTMST